MTLSLLLIVLALILIGVILISVLAVVLVAVLIVVLDTIAVLIIHNLLPSSSLLAVFRLNSMPWFSGLILCFKQKTD